MNTIKGGGNFSRRRAFTQIRGVISGVFLAAFLASAAKASVPILPGGGGTNSGPAILPIQTWSFYDHTNWTDNAGYPPVSFGNLNYSWLGNGSSLVVATNIAAWLQYNVWETNGTTNLTVDSGTVSFWFASSSWSSTNAGGMGPGEWTQLIDVGELTTNAVCGYWGLSIDPDGQNLWFVSQDGGGNTYTLSTPASWTPNYFHFVTLTYCSTNVSIYLDGELATNDPGGLSIWPSSEVLSNGVFFGSDTNGLMEAQGMFDTVQTYNYPLSADAIQSIFNQNILWYEMDPYNTAMANFSSAPTSQTTYAPYNDVITGPGNLVTGTNVADCIDGTNLWNVWITNVIAKAAGSGNMTISFTIEGSSNTVPSVPFDVFANSVLSFGPNGVPWAWEGQGYRCINYTLTVPSATCFLILGTPQDSDGDGLTDAYESLVSKSNPNSYSTDGTGMADGWEVLYFGHTGVAPNGDPDGDGLTTFQEWLMNSENYNPVKWNSFTNSVVGDGYQNYSGDGLANLMQASFGGNMLTNNVTWRINTSGDGLSDEYKTMAGLSTNSAVASPGLPTGYSLNPIP
jgi:hypothetical protein